jgi:hypothetical protein
MRTLESIFQPCEMAFYIKAVKEQYAIKILACLTEKLDCTYSPYTLNELTLSLTSKILAQHGKKFRSFLSVVYKMQRAKKPSHTTVPLSIIS